MLSSITVALQQDYVTPLVIPVMNPSPDAPFFVRKVTGLEPVTADITSREFATLDGGFFTGSHVGKRNIVLTLGLNTRLGHVSVSEARALLFGYFGPKQSLLLIFTSTDQPTVLIPGYVESAVHQRFDQDPEVVISVICPKPSFLSDTPTVITGYSGVDPSYTTVTYLGNVQTGFTLAMAFEDELYEGIVSVEHQVLGPSGPTGPIRKFKVEDAIFGEPDWVFWLNTNRGQKVVQALEPGTPDIAHNLLPKMTDDSLWIQLFPGDNLIKVKTPDSISNFVWGLTFVKEFGGI